MIFRRRESGELSVGDRQPDVPTTRAGDRTVRSLALLAGATAAIVALARFGPSSKGLVAAVFLAALTVLACVDFERHLLPNKIVLPCAALVLALQLLLFPNHAFEWIAASLGTFLALLVLSLIRPGGLGMGDVKLGLLLGAGLGAEVVQAVFIGFLALWPVAVWMLIRDGAEARKRAIPLGPALAFGAGVVMLLG
jgi:leader peptidase (prepilin peptidase) / N-methyltransferase